MQFQNQILENEPQIFGQCSVNVHALADNWEKKRLKKTVDNWILL